MVTLKFLTYHHFIIANNTLHHVNNVELQRYNHKDQTFTYKSEHLQDVVAILAKYGMYSNKSFIGPACYNIEE